VAANEAESTDDLARRVKKLPEVAKVDVRVEESERSFGGIDINSITLTLTAVGGMVGGTSLLINQIRELIKSVRGLRRALVETADGPKPLDSVSSADLEKS